MVESTIGLSIGRRSDKGSSCRTVSNHPDFIRFTRHRGRFLLALRPGIPFPAARMSSLPTADLLALDLDGLKSRLSKLRRYL
jgi:hypothetical protein